LAFSSGVSFENQKASQKQFDDFKADVYSFLKNCFYLARENGWAWGLHKATPIRFMTFDRNAAMQLLNVTGNIEWNRLMALKYLPRLLHVAETPQLFFEGGFEIFRLENNSIFSSSWKIRSKPDHFRLG